MRRSPSSLAAVADAVHHEEQLRSHRRRALGRIRILDFSIALTGPYAAALLADQGAEVIKVERPGIGDIARWVGVSVNGMSALYPRVQPGQALDRRSTSTARRASRSCCRLAADADVVVQNFRPGVIDRLGLGYDDVRAVNPDVVYASLSGFGTDGPVPRPQRLRHRRSRRTAASPPTRPTPTAVPVFLRQTAADKVTALYACQAITAALLRAGERGRAASTSSCP